MWPWKNFLTPLGAVLALAAAVIPSLYGIAWWVTALAILFVGGLVIVKSGDRVYVADVFESLSGKQKDRVATLVRIAVSAYVVWAIIYVVNPEWNVYLWVTLPIIGAVIYGGARNEEYHVAHTKLEDDKAANRETLEEQTAVKKARALIDFSGHPRVRILAFRRIGDPAKGTGGQQVEVQIPTTGMGK